MQISVVVTGIIKDALHTINSQIIIYSPCAEYLGQLLHNLLKIVQTSEWKMSHTAASLRTGRILSLHTDVRIWIVK